MQRRKLVDNQWVAFLEDKFLLDNGTECTYYHAQKSDAVMAIAVDYSNSEAYTYIVNQYRHPIEQTIWQFPIGGFELTEEDPTNAAKKELREETGVVSQDMTLLGSFFADPGFTNQKLYVCATDTVLEILPPVLENTEQGLIFKRVKVSEISTLVECGEMGDAWGIAGLHYLNLFLNK